MNLARRYYYESFLTSIRKGLALKRLLVMKMKLLLILCSMALGSCSAFNNDPKNNTAPDTSLETKVPNTWQTATVNQEIDIFDGGWLATFNDPKLATIAKQVLAHNHDIKAAAARVDAAQAAAKKAGAALQPVVNANVGAQRQANLDNAKSSSFGASLDVSWELDVWSRVRAGKEAATSSLAASQADLQAAQQSLVAQAVKAYFLSIEATNQEQYAGEIYRNYEKSLKVAEAFFREGVTSLQNVALGKSELARAEDTYEKAKNAKTQALRSLELLLGKYPSGEFEVAASLPPLPAPVPTGVPAELLERRPDLVAAERRVATAFNRTTSAKAARLPQIALTGSFGGSSSVLSEIADPTNVFWNLASNLIAPIFDGGGRKADVEIATAEQEEALAQYKKAALAAFADVENALSNEQTLLKRVLALQEAYKQARVAEQIAELKYEQGDGVLLDVLQIKRSAISTNIERLRAEQELLSERVNLYLALGGNITTQ